MHAALQARGTAINGKAFTVKAFGSRGTAEGTVKFQKGSDYEFKIDNSISDVDFICEKTLSGSNLIVIIQISQKGPSTVSPDHTQEAFPAAVKGPRVKLHVSLIS